MSLDIWFIILVAMDTVVWLVVWEDCLLVCWLFGCFGWLVGWLMGLLLGSFVGCLVGGFVGCLVVVFVGSVVGGFVSWLVVVWLVGLLHLSCCNFLASSWGSNITRSVFRAICALIIVACEISFPKNPNYYCFSLNIIIIDLFLHFGTLSNSNAIVRIAPLIFHNYCPSISSFIFAQE